MKPQTHHDIDDENGDIAKGASATPQVGEALVTRRVNNQQTGDLVFLRAVCIQNRCLLPDRIHREVRRADLLCDTTGFALLDIRLTDLVEQLGLAGIDVTENAADRTTKVVLVCARPSFRHALVL